MILGRHVAQRRAVLQFHLMEDAAKVDAACLPVALHPAGIEPVDPAHHLGHRAKAHFGHDRAQFFSDEEHVIDHVFGLTGKARAQHRVLRGNADRAGVEVAFAHHDAPRGDQRRGGKAKLVGPQQRADGDVAAGAQPPIDLHCNAAAQVIEQQRLLGFGKADFPRAARVRQAGQRRCARPAVKARNGDMIRARFRYARRDRSHADFGHQLHRNPCDGVHVFQIVDQLRQILDRIDIVVRRRRNQAYARG